MEYIQVKNQDELAAFVDYFLKVPEANYRQDFSDQCILAHYLNFKALPEFDRLLISNGGQKHPSLIFAQAVGVDLAVAVGIWKGRFSTSWPVTKKQADEFLIALRDGLVCMYDSCLYTDKK